MPPIADRYDLFVFDLDGTLVDSLADLAASVNVALAALSHPPLSLDAVRAAVGNGARKLIERSLGSDAAALDKALGIFLRDYAESCTHRTRPYPDVAETLAALEKRGASLAVLTNKPLAMTEKILAELRLARFVGSSVIAGDQAPAKPDPSGLLSLIAAAGATPRRTLMVGDMPVDVETARAAETHAAGVLYGFQPDRVRDAEPDHLLASLADLVADGPVGARAPIPVD